MTFVTTDISYPCCNEQPGKIHNWPLVDTAFTDRCFMMRVVSS